MIKHKVIFGEEELLASDGQNLRNLLKKPNYLNCKGLGTCGTCAVKITGSVNPPNRIESFRLKLHPFIKDSKLRLACQICIKNDLKVTKFKGFWGEEEI
jgi:ferredoxin